MVQIARSSRENSDDTKFKTIRLTSASVVKRTNNQRQKLKLSVITLAQQFWQLEPNIWISRLKKTVQCVHFNKIIEPPQLVTAEADDNILRAVQRMAK